MKHRNALATVLITLSVTSCGGEKNNNDSLSSPEAMPASAENQSAVEPAEGAIGSHFTPAHFGENQQGLPQSIESWELVAIVCTDLSPDCQPEGIIANNEGVVALHSMGAGSQISSTIISGSPLENFTDLKPPLIKHTVEYVVDFYQGFYNIRTGQYEPIPNGFSLKSVIDGGALIGEEGYGNPYVNANGSLFDYDGELITVDSLFSDEVAELNPNNNSTWHCGFDLGNGKYQVAAILWDGPSLNAPIVLLDINSSGPDSYQIIDRSVILPGGSKFQCGQSLYGQSIIFSDGAGVHRIINGQVVVAQDKDLFSNTTITHLGYLQHNKFDAREVEVALGELNVEAPPRSRYLASTENKLYIITDQGPSGSVEVWSADVNF